jgi:hypothetical protein
VEIAELAAVDWAAPWLVPFAGLGSEVAAAEDWRGALNCLARQQGITTASGLPLVFDAPEAAQSEAYESFIARSGRVPTRANLHDFFNALVWLRFPRCKARLNALQVAAITRDGIGAQRGTLRDAATLIDENAVLVATLRADLIDALRAHDWRRLFVRQRDAWQQARVIAFGHALIGKLVQPYKAITAHALHVPLPPTAALEQIDAALAVQLDEGHTPRALAPLPVLGIPGWCSGNVESSFYEDPVVFRPPRVRRC